MSWQSVPLGDVVEIRGGGTPSKANPRFWGGDIPWVSPKDMKRWEISDAEDKITAEAVTGSATNLIPENSILLVNRSGILKHTLPVGITRRQVAINQDIKALICGRRADPNYIARIVKAAEPIVLKWVRATTADNFSIDNLSGSWASHCHRSTSSGGSQRSWTRRMRCDASVSARSKFSTD